MKNIKEVATYVLIAVFAVLMLITGVRCDKVEKQRDEYKRQTEEMSKTNEALQKTVSQYESNNVVIREFYPDGKLKREIRRVKVSSREETENLRRSMETQRTEYETRIADLEKRLSIRVGNRFLIGSGYLPNPNTVAPLIGYKAVYLSYRHELGEGFALRNFMPGVYFSLP